MPKITITKINSIIVKPFFMGAPLKEIVCFKLSEQGTMIDGEPCSPSI